MNTITVNASGKYDVLIGKGLIDKCGELIGNVIKTKRAAVITDDNVAGLYLERVTQALKKSGFETAEFVFPNGEASKSHSVLIKIYSFLAREHFTRSDCIIALGGGVTGDMSGYAAATYLRGMDYIQIPTSLLAQVDSSVGGKTAVDIPEGKNLVGAFKQPKLVICDINALSTLPRDFLVDGMGEVVKYGMIRSAELFNILMNHTINDIEEVIEDVVYRCIEIKRDIVEADEFDKGERMLLNFGHTLGHSIEQYYNYTGISHGRAVAAGMEIITALAAKRNLCGQELCGRLSACLERYELKTPGIPSSDKLGQACLNDKKRSGSGISVIICSDIGKSFALKLNLDEFLEFIGCGNPCPKK